jgi:hypothetical protein
MLSPHTLSGTKVVCINAQDCEGYLREGQVYTLRRILEPVDNFCPVMGAEVVHGVTLEEVDPVWPADGFHPRRFIPAVLPKCLTDLLIPEMA